MAPHHHACRVILMLLLSGGVSAQEPVQRKGLGGYVRDKAGQAWVGAEVHLVSRILPGNEWIGEPDHQVVQSGKRGRFSAKVLPDREYLVWAVSQPQAGLYRSTRPRVGVISGPIRLRERVGPLVQVQISIGGDKHWKPPFGIKVTGAPSELALGDRRVGDPHEVFPVTLDAEGRGMLPLLPWPEVTVEIQDRRGVQLWAPVVSLSHADRKMRLEEGPGTDPARTIPREQIQTLTESVLHLPKPAPRKIRVTDGAGLPLAGTRLGQRIRGKFVLVTMSDAEGYLETDLPRRTRTHWDKIFELRGNSRLVLHRNGYFEIPAAFPAVPGAAIKMTASKGHKGRVLVAPGVPLAKNPLILYVIATGQVQQPVLLMTDAEGRFEISQDIRRAWVLTALLEDSIRRRFARDDGAPVSRHAILASKGTKAMTPEFEVDLSKLRRLEFDLIRADRSPASFARLDAFKFSGFNSIPPMFQTRADRRGRVALLLGTCKQALFVGQDEGGYAAIDIADYEGRTPLQLTGLLRLSGVVRYKDGRPAASAKIRVDHTYLGRRRSGANKNSARGLIMGFHLGHRCCGRSDEAGRFSISVPAGAETVPLWVTPAGTKERIQLTVEMDQSSRKDVPLVIR